jgi:hypothetical protein
VRRSSMYCEFVDPVVLLPQLPVILEYKVRIVRTVREERTLLVQATTRNAARQLAFEEAMRYDKAEHGDTNAADYTCQECTIATDKDVGQ